MELVKITQKLYTGLVKLQGKMILTLIVILANVMNMGGVSK